MDKKSYMILVGVLMIVAAATLYIKSNVETLMEQVFISQCDEIKNKISERLNDHARILRSGAALFDATKEVTRDVWRIFTRQQEFEMQLPGIQGVGFSLLIPRERLTRHIQGIRREGFPEYKLRPDGDREVYSSIIYLEPFADRNLRAFGYDMFSEPVRRAAMERARDMNAPALSGKVVLVQETDKEIQAGTLMYVPVYQKGMPVKTVEQRRAAIYGWVYSPYRMNDLVQGIISRQNLGKENKIHIQIFDGVRPSPQSLLYENHPGLGRKNWSEERFTRQSWIDFHGQIWTLSFGQVDDGIFTVAYISVWLTLAGGIFIALLLFALIRSLLATRVRAQRIAAKLTVELRRMNDRLLLAARAGGVGIWDYDVVSNNLVWDDQMYFLYGAAPDNFSGALDAWLARVHPEDRQRGDHETQLALRGEKEFDTEFRVLWPEGTIRNIRALAVVQRDAAGKPLRMIGTNWDITAQKQAENTIAASLLEKETMLKEIHHRVKNNLQIVASLLNTQSSYLQNDKAREAFQESIDRVRAMAMIHAQLYEFQDLTRIDFGRFIQDLIGNIIQSYGGAEFPVEITMDVGGVSLGIDNSIPCGLILNELVSNALKHAFPEKKEGTIHIRMRLEDNRVTITVQDNGIGFPEPLDLTKVKSMGLRLVNILVRQLSGKIDMQVDSGTTWTITFFAKNEREWQNGSD
jgi:two-component sensor histidine kinase/CHASE1-domain containing sensor protein